MVFDIHAYLRSVESLLSTDTPFVTATLVDIRGSAPQIQGAKAIISQRGIEAGTVGGGKVEAATIRHAQELLKNRNGTQCEFLTWNLQTDIGMTCGGEVKLLFEVTLGNDWHIALFGAGHIAQSLVPILLGLSCRVCWIDQREEWLGRTPDHPKLTKVCVEELRTQVASQPDKAFFVLMTQGHSTDLPVLAEVLKTRSAPYVGVLGSLQKAKVLHRDLQAMDLGDRTDSFFCPMGLPIGNNTPPEIAISIAAQLVQERDRIGILQHKSKKF